MKSDISLTIEFPVIIKRDRISGGYNAECTELNIFSQGESKQEAEQNIKEAIQVHIEAMTKLGKIDEMLEKLGVQLHDVEEAEKKKKKILPVERTLSSVGLKVPITDVPSEATA